MSLFATETCQRHPDREAIGYCRACHQPFCQECLLEVRDYLVCREGPCRSKMSARRQAEARDRALARARQRDLQKAGEDALGCFLFFLFIMFFKGGGEFFGKRLLNYLTSSSDSRSPSSSNHEASDHEPKHRSSRLWRKRRKRQE